MTRAAVRIRQAMRRSQDVLRAIADWSIADQVVPELVVSDDRLSWSLVARFRSRPPTDDWGVLLGEALHHLRSGLDNAVYSRAAQHAGGVPASPRDLRFPIFDNEHRYKSSVRRCLGDAYQEVEPIARAFQPFGVDRGESFLQPGGALRGQHPLSLLAALNNLDKHREWAVMPVGIDQITLGSDDSPFMIEFDDLTGVENPVIETLDFRGDNLADGGAIMAARCRSTIKRMEAVGAIRAAVGVPTPAGPIQADQLLLGLTFVCGLIMFRIEDPWVDIDVIHRRLEVALGEGADLSGAVRVPPV